MTYADQAERSALIEGFRAIADYLESNPEVPAARDVTVYVFPPEDDCAVMRAEIDAIAARLGTSAWARGQHYTASRSFGLVEYRAVAICKHHHDDSEG
jgi:hypothetical protein